MMNIVIKSPRQNPLLAVVVGLLVGCGSTGPKTDADYKQDITQGMQGSLQGNLKALVAATQALQQAAPDRPWDATDPALPAMRSAWIQARQAYEQIEGATAPIFPDIDTSIDGRVEDFGPSGTNTLSRTCDPFAGQCLSGLHAIERVLYADVTPPAVAVYENGLGYVPPQAFPSTQPEADEFKNELCAKAATDAKALLDGWMAPQIDIGSAFQGLVSLMNEQKEKVTKAGQHEEESRYSQRTMDDLRQNLLGTTNIYRLFQPWLQSKANGPDVDARIESGFQALNTLYQSSQYEGPMLPPPPADWNDANPSAADLQTVFGQLYAAIATQVDPSKAGSVVYEMNAAATACGLPVFSQ